MIMTYRSRGEAELAHGDGSADQAHAVLPDAIWSHRIPPGTRLSVPEIQVEGPARRAAEDG
jgi:DNA-binding GntR family transcriptional regulator